jgi:hypothetical protein
MPKTKKTPLELMREIRASDEGEEKNHYRADALLCRLVREYVPNGRKVVEEFYSIDKWYA